MSSPVTVVDGLDHPECVVVSADGTIFAGSEAGAIYRVTVAQGSPVVEQLANTGGFVLGLALDAAGDLYACDVGAVLRINSTGDVSVISRGSDEVPMRTPNFPVFLADGNLLVSDSGTWEGQDGCIFRIRPDGDTSVWSTSTSAFPNGMALSADHRYLYIIESAPPAVRRTRIVGDGTAGETELVVELPGTVPDGIAVDVEGGLIVSCYRPDRILRIAPDGSLATLAEDPAGTVLAAPTNVAVDPTDPRRLYVANFARWHISRLTLDIAAVPPVRPTR